MQPYHILINGLSIGGGGGYTVGRELLRHLALERPAWTITLALVEGNRLHEQMRSEQLPANCRLLWAPPAAAGRFGRRKYENKDLAKWADTQHVTAVVQLNGMMVPALRRPVLAHNQDPWPYRPEAWSGLKDRATAFLKRIAHARALRRADCVGWTSQYLRDLVCNHSGIHPARSEIFYNGLPESWITRVDSALPPWETRPLDLISVSEVSVYKRQSLVIQALPLLLRRPEFATLKYRIVGNCAAPYEDELKSLARSLGVADHVVFEGRVSDDRLQQLLCSAKCFVLMSVCESFGIPAIEAMSFGTPVVTSDCCAMPEVCGDAAELCPADDLEALAQRLARVLSDASRAEGLRRAGALRVKQFSWTTTARKMASCLEEIAQARKPSQYERA